MNFLWKIEIWSIRKNQTGHTQYSRVLRFLKKKKIFPCTKWFFLDLKAHREEGKIKLNLKLIDTPGYGSHYPITSWYKLLKEYIKSKVSYNKEAVFFLNGHSIKKLPPTMKGCGEVLLESIRSPASQSTITGSMFVYTSLQDRESRGKTYFIWRNCRNMLISYQF